MKKPVVCFLFVALAIALGPYPAEGSGDKHALQDESTEMQPSSGGEDADNNDPEESHISCTCEGHICSCDGQLKINNIPDHNGQTESVSPNINLDFVGSNMSVIVTAKIGDRVLHTQAVSGQNPPPVCFPPIPQFPLLLLCVRFRGLSFDQETQEVSTCVDLEAHTSVPPMAFAKWPMGCFKGSWEREIKWTGAGSPSLIAPKIPGNQ